MSFRLVDTGWDAVLNEAIRADRSCTRIVCPFIKKGAARRLLARGRPQMLQIITRFNLGDFCAGVSGLAALRLLLDNGAVRRAIGMRPSQRLRKRITRPRAATPMSPATEDSCSESRCVRSIGQSRCLGFRFQSPDKRCAVGNS